MSDLFSVVVAFRLFVSLSGGSFWLLHAPVAIGGVFCVNGLVLWFKSFLFGDKICSVFTVIVFLDASFNIA